ncbi:hypothetical protein [uncultured Ruminococcus sp.]|uniref:hypothetical protein n=1 Tax=uncultured Ruminococcus sp. TaxID=165186 RepID=UPI0025E47045|nr:hypothetical protein [uncultured Ruminococcus sp.]
MTDLRKQIDELAAIKADMGKLKERKDKLEAEIIKQCSADLENTKYKSIRYEGDVFDLTAVTAESLKVIYNSFLPTIFGKAYEDAVTEKTDYTLSAPAKRMLIGLYKGNFIRATVKEVIDQMAGVTDDERKQLLKKCKGINYDKDVDNIRKFTELSEEDAKEYAYLIAEAAVWQDFCNLLTLNGIADEAQINDILMKIQSAFVVEDSTKISLS